MIDELVVKPTVTMKIVSVFANLLFLTKKIKKKLGKSMKRWQSYRRPNFRSQQILSEFFASQTAIKKCLNTRVDYTVLHAIVHADWPVQMLSVVIASSRAWAARSSIDQPSSPNFAPLGDQNPNLSLTSFKRRRTWQQEQAKKSTGQSFHRVCSCRFCWTGPAAMIAVALRAEDSFKKKHWTVNCGEMNTPIAHYWW